jgi:two-component system cell cycle response regulator
VEENGQIRHPEKNALVGYNPRAVAKNEADMLIILTVGVNKEITSGIQQRLKSNNVTLLHTDSIQEAVNFIKRRKISLILLNNCLPEEQNYREFCIIVRSQEKLADIPIILLGEAREDTATRIEILKSVLVNDYISLPVAIEEMVARVNIFVELRVLQEELESRNVLLQKMAITDELTKLFNRRHIFERLKEEIDRIRRHHYIFSCILADLDHFKKVNDTLGHQAGDTVLVELAKLFKQNIRSIDIIGRYGGEEFLVVQPYTNLEQGIVAAERLRKLVLGHRFSALEKAGALTLSIGLVSFVSGEKLEVDEVIRAVDKQLYQAKENGRNRVCSTNYGS